VLFDLTFEGEKIGADGVGHKAVFLENATCTTLVVTVHAGRAQKSASLDF
jgi:hypothetical protein